MGLVTSKRRRPPRRSARCPLSQQELIDVTNAVGMAVSGPTADVVPADRKIYALRDATATITAEMLTASGVIASYCLCWVAELHAPAEFFCDGPAGSNCLTMRNEIEFIDARTNKIWLVQRASALG